MPNIERNDAPADAHPRHDASTIDIPKGDDGVLVRVVDDGAQLKSFLADYAQGVVSTPGNARMVAQSQWHAQHPTESALAAFRRAHRFGLPLIDLSKMRADARAIELVPPHVARRLQVVPIAVTDGVLGVAVGDPANPDLVSTLNFLRTERMAFLVAQPEEVKAVIAEMYDHVEDAAVARQLGLDVKSPADNGNEQDAQRLAQEQPIVRLVEDIFAEAARRGASDIHLRPGIDGVDLLYRIDGELIAVRTFLRTLCRALASRIKVLGNMNVADHRIAQDGRATYTTSDGKKIDLRISVLPTVHGESVAVRLLDTARGLRNIEQLGFSPADQTRFLDLMTRDHGMILVTGPTGSGKSTTLYAALLEAKKECTNILTVEDPVEYEIDDVQQMQVNRAAGFTFATALRNILRHDPDVIMVGEIRDGETAQIAVESALTGHLLFSTLHTNTAATTITRLLDLGVEAFLLRSTLLGILSQRLLRRNCPDCLSLESVPAHWRATLGVRDDEQFMHGIGCGRCEGTGVRGRVAAYELLSVTPSVRRLIQPRCEAQAIHETALQEGMVPIAQHALALARQHVISFHEAFLLRPD